ncbi:hypothetical protein Hanom_Chr09g00867781 [Helianthus anomalus]
MVFMCKKTQKKKLLPESNVIASVIWDIRQCGLINVENPNVLAISCEVKAFGILIGFRKDIITVLAVLFSKHVMPDIFYA